jgi:indole-3-glycerol phosphate synthase
MAWQLGLAPLVEVHDTDELSVAIGIGARVIGVNNRNLKTLAVDASASLALVDAIPAETVAVAESGLRSAEDLRLRRAAGYDAFLVGERLMAADEPGRALAALLEGERS